MKDIVKISNNSKFSYSFDLESGIIINENDDTTITVPVEKMEAIKALSNKRFTLSEPILGTDDFKDWVYKHISKSDISEYIAAILVNEGYAKVDADEMIISFNPFEENTNQDQNQAETQEENNNAQNTTPKHGKTIRSIDYLIILLLVFSLAANAFLYSKYSNFNSMINDKLQTEEELSGKISKIQTNLNSIIKKQQLHDEDLRDIKSNLEFYKTFTINHIDDISKLKNDTAFLSLYETGYDTVRNSHGSVFFISIDSFEHYGNGIKLTLTIGNPYNINYTEFDFIITAYNKKEGALFSDADFMYETLKNDIGVIKPGWNTFTYTLQDYDTDKYSTINISEFNVSKIVILNQ